MSVFSSIDTNIVVYAFGDDRRADAAGALLRSGPIVSVQLLNEFVNVARRKLRYDWPRLDRALEMIERQVTAILPITRPVHGRARLICQRYQLSFYDSLMLAAAVQGGATTFYSEDMQHGLVVEDKLTIIDPFR